MTYRLPKEFAEKWIAALESGKYPQGKNILYNKEDGNYCCLGVACEIAGHQDDLFKEGDMDFIYRTSSSSDEYDDADDIVIFKDVPDELKSDTSLADALANLNDSGHSFSNIAAWIRDNVELY